MGGIRPGQTILSSESQRRDGGQAETTHISFEHAPQTRTRRLQSTVRVLALSQCCKGGPSAKRPTSSAAGERTYITLAVKQQVRESQQSHVARSQLWDPTVLPRRFPDRLGRGRAEERVELLAHAYERVNGRKVGGEADLTSRGFSVALAEQTTRLRRKGGQRARRR